MLTYFLKCKKDTKKLDSKLLKTKIAELLSSKCPVCGNKKSRFMEEQEVRGLLSSLGFRTQLSRIPLLGEDILF